MLISIVNFTKGAKAVSDPDVQTVVRAVNRQIAEDFAPSWSMPATLRLEGRSVAEANDATLDDLRGDAILYLVTSVKDTDGVLGYHDRNARGIPFGFVYTDISEKLKEPWSTTLSHEALELIADPEANLLVMGPHPNEERIVFHWYEMCDAVQAQRYKVDGVEVSNFVLPLYFTGTRDVDEVGARNNFLGAPLQSFGIAPGGYVGFFDPKTGGHDQVFAAKGEIRADIKSQAKQTRRGLRYADYQQRFGRIAARQAVGKPAPQRLTVRAAGDVAAVPARPKAAVTYASPKSAASKR
jgi:hypothetical protein